MRSSLHPCHPLLFLLALGILVTGCASNLSTRKRTNQVLPYQSRVGVLPFENVSGSENASEIITGFFQNAVLAGDRWVVLEYGEVYDGLRRNRIRSASTMSSATMREFAADVGLDYVILGSVIEYEEHNNTFLGRVPFVSFNCRLVECATGKTVWVAGSNGRGDKGELLFGIGAVRSAENLAREMVEDAVNELSGQFARR